MTFRYDNLEVNQVREEVEAVVFDDVNYPNVRKWWDMIKVPYRHIEIVKQNTLWNGLGVIYF